MEEQNMKRVTLRSEGLKKIYGKRTVVSDVSFQVSQGEIVGLLGPNGAGKTTSFYMTTGLVIPNEGHIFIDDVEITKLPVYKRARMGIGYLAQEASVFRKMSVEDNILSVLELVKKPEDFDGSSSEYRRWRLESLLNEFSLQKIRKNLGDQCSDCSLPGHRPEVHHAGRALRRRRPHCRGGYPVHRVETEAEEHRRAHHRP